MPRNYSRGNIKGKHQSYTDEDLRKALNAVKKGMALRKASQLFGVPFTTLSSKHGGIDDSKVGQRLAKSRRGRSSHQ